MCGRDDAAGYTGAKHEAVEGFEFLLAAFVADVAVVLLVEAVEFSELGVVFGNGAGDGFMQAFFDGAAQVGTAFFDSFYGCFGWFAHGNSPLVDIFLVASVSAQLVEGFGCLFGGLVGLLFDDG